MPFETSEIFKILYQGKDKVFFIKILIKNNTNQRILCYNMNYNIGDIYEVAYFRNRKWRSIKLL